MSGDGAEKSSVEKSNTEKQGDAQKDGPEKKEQTQELSEEDKLLQENLTMLVERLQEEDTDLYKPALESLRSQIRASTSSMTSVPKPLKFLRPHYDDLKALHEKWSDGPDKCQLADIISVLAMTQPEGRECLKYHLVGTSESLASWGHEYVRHVSGELSVEYADKSAAKEAVDHLITLVEEIVPYDMQHNAEAEACDLLMELERITSVISYIDENTYPRVCLYLFSHVRYVPEPEDAELLRTCYDIYLKFKQYPHSLRMAMMLNSQDLVREVFDACDDQMICKQMAFMLGRQQLFLELDEDFEGSEHLTEIMSNVHLNTNFLLLGRELDIMEAKTPEDIYKTHLETQRSSFGSAQVDSARQNLASSFVNGFVNTGFGSDKLMTEDGNKWIWKNKDSGMMSATASLGLILLWDVDGGLTQIDKYLYSNEDHIKAGALLACGIVNTGVRNDCDPALALLSDYVSHSSLPMRMGAILGLGLAYTGTNREEVFDTVATPLTEGKSTLDVTCLTALSLGLISVGCCHAELTSHVLETMMQLSPEELKDPNARLLALALGLTYLGRQEAADVTIETLKAVPGPLGHWARMLVDVCAYAGTGNVLKVQQLLHICSEHFDTKDKDKPDAKKKDAGASSGPSTSGSSTSSESTSSSSNDKGDKAKAEKEKTGKTGASDGSHQGMAVLGIALIAMGEEIGTDMSLRSFGHLLQYGEPVIRRAVPLALALLSVSHPRLPILDTLSKLSHDADSVVTLNAILAMGLVGAGTNNARLAAMLRQLAQYHYKDENALFMVRIAQGLTHLGKGTLTLSPYHSDRALLSQVSLAGLLSLLVLCLDVKSTILSGSHYLLYLLSTAIQPRMVVTLNEDLEPLPVSVRVGQAVDVVGQAGRPKTITGFQTHTTPVLLQAGERAELATEDYEPLTPLIEGFVILRKIKPEDD